MRWIWYVVAVLWILDALRMRARLAAIHVLETPDQPTSDEYSFLTTPGVALDDRTKLAASAYAAAQGLELLDLIPGDLPVVDAIALAQVVDTKTYRANRIARGHTTGYAMLAAKHLLARADVEPRALLDPRLLVQLGRRLKRYANEHADLAIAPSLKAPAGPRFTDWPVFSEALGGMSHSMFMLKGLVLLLLLVGLFVSPVAGLVALAALHLQVFLAIAGLKLAPRDLLLVVLFRTPLDCWSWLNTLRTRLSEAKVSKDPVEERRPYYQALLGQGIDGFFEARREACPLCGSPDLGVKLRTSDLIQAKPGRFTLEQCRKCGHIFQNPRLSPAGLSFYYRDFYDGLGAGRSETMFRGKPELYLNRARSIQGLGQPARWLDVGTGQGHFCCAAKGAWPETQFDGLDIDDGIEEALRAGWVGRGFRGFLPDIAPSVAGQYDVVSLFHCLEHTPDPYAELDAAHQSLGDRGLLVIEVPDPECVLGKLLGRFWLPWFQPQHLHLFSVANLSNLLRQKGFEPVLTQRTEVHTRVDMFACGMMLYGWLAPKPNAPWAPRPKWTAKLRYFVVWRLGFPLLPVFWMLDFALAPIFRKAGVSNAYRIVAQKTAMSRPAAIEVESATAAV